MNTADAPHTGGSNPYGPLQALEQGGLLAWGIFIILVIMSASSWYVLFVKLFEQQKIVREGRRARTAFWQAGTLRDGAQKLEKHGAYRQIVDDGIRALEQHDTLTAPIDQHDWMLNSLARSQGAIASKLTNGLALLATVGSTAPFVGLLGTVIGIYKALINIGLAGQASIDKVAGPVGESLIMTAIGLAVAVPAVLSYNWLMRRNKAIIEELARFANDLHGYMVSGGTVKPVVVAPSAGATRPATTATGSATGATTSSPKKV